MAFQKARWIRFLEKKIPGLAIPHLGILLVTLQALGFLFLTIDPIWVMRLALIPEMVKVGEYWRLITFLALPATTSPFWIIFSLWFLYFLMQLIEEELGSFVATLYVLISVCLIISFSLGTDYPITQIADFQSTLFLAAATLFPEIEAQVFFILPVKLKWLAMLSVGFVLIQMISGDSLSRLSLLVTYSNYLIFFGPELFRVTKRMVRQAQFKNKMKR